MAKTSPSGFHSPCKPAALDFFNNMISSAIWCNKHLRLCAVLLSLKNLLIFIYTRLHSKSCYYLYLSKSTNFINVNFFSLCIIIVIIIPVLIVIVNVIVVLILFDTIIVIVVVVVVFFVIVIIISVTPLILLSIFLVLILILSRS